MPQYAAQRPPLAAALRRNLGVAPTWWRQGEASQAPFGSRPRRHPTDGRGLARPRFDRLRGICVLRCGPIQLLPRACHPIATTAALVSVARAVTYNWDSADFSTCGSVVQTVADGCSGCVASCQHNGPASFCGGTCDAGYSNVGNTAIGSSSCDGGPLCVPTALAGADYSECGMVDAAGDCLVSTGSAPSL